ncbi:MAG: TIGR03621 family F420-dependent LLM class oxidoreductase [Chloroflexota bacterium]
MTTVRTFRFGIVTAGARSGEEWVARAQRAEALGYSTLLMPDRIAPLLSSIPALAVAAAATRTLRVGTFVIASGLRNPVLLAHEVATLDFLSGGRFELGLGAGVGEDDYRQAGIPFERPGPRVDRLAETLDIVKAMLSGDEVSRQGAHYTVDAARGFPPPIQQPRPPILVAGGGKRLLSLAAREADIVALGVGATAREEVLREKVEWVRQEAGDRFPALELSLNLIAALGDAPPDARVRGRVHAVFHVELEDLARSGSPFVVSGTVEEWCQQLFERRERLGVSYVTISDDQMEAFAPVVEQLTGK